MTTASPPQARVIGGRCPSIPTGTLVRVLGWCTSSTPDKPGAVTAVLPSGRRVVLSAAAIEYTSPLSD